MKKTRIRMLSWMLGILFSMALAVNAAAAEKNALDSYKAVREGKTATIGKTTYGIKYNSNYTWSIYAKKGSTQKTLIKKAGGGTYVTDGKYLYYATGTYKGHDGNGIPAYSSRKVYKYSISGKKSTLIYKKSGTGLAFVPVASDGRYLYLGNETQYGGCYGGLSVYDMKTKKMVSLKKDVCRIQMVKDKLLVSAENFPHGGNLFLMNKNGTKVISLTKEYVDEYRIEGKYIYFKEQTYGWDWRNCRCKLDGSGKKALTSWKPGY